MLDGENYLDDLESNIKTVYKKRIESICMMIQTSRVVVLITYHICEHLHNINLPEVRYREEWFNSVQLLFINLSHDPKTI